MFEKGQFFDLDLQKKIREEFYFLDSDGEYGKRIFFDNSGGALSLKKCVEKKAELERFPDCPERNHKRGVDLKRVVEEGEREILKTVFGAKSGALITELTASQTMFHMVEIILENIDGTNAVVSSVEHPSAFDAMEYYCTKTGKELRVVNPRSDGFVYPEDVVALVDKDTSLVSVMSASNVSGNIMDIEGIVKAVRAVKPDVFVISDAVQHAPHAVMDVEKTGVDGMNFAPYKFFGTRGAGFAYVSDRVAHLCHRKLIKKPDTVFALGTPTPSDFISMLEVISYVCRIGAHYTEEVDRRALFCEGMNRIHLQERALLDYMLTGLRKIKGVKIFIDSDDISRRDLIAAIGFDNTGFKEAAELYEKNGVIVCERVLDSMYSKRILEALRLPGAIRVSPLHCHNCEDIDAFLDVTRLIAR